jgi:hypothetical protein
MLGACVAEVGHVFYVELSLVQGEYFKIKKKKTNITNRLIDILPWDVT